MLKKSRPSSLVLTCGLRGSKCIHSEEKKKCQNGDERWICCTSLMPPCTFPFLHIMTCGTLGTRGKWSLISLGSGLKVHTPQGDAPPHLSSSSVLTSFLYSTFLLLLLLREQQKVSGAMDVWMGLLGHDWLQSLFACQVAAFVSVMLRSVGYHSNQHVTRLAHTMQSFTFRATD